MNNYRFSGLLILVIIFHSCMLDDCFNKSSYISSFEKFVDETEAGYKDYSKADWEKSRVKFEKFTGECYEKFEKDLSPEEESKILRNSLRYSFYRLSGELPIDLKNKDVKKFSDEVEKLFDKEKDLNKIVEKIKSNNDFKKASKDLQRGLEHFGKGMEELGKELEKIFKDSEK
ncbi:MAG: DUF6565 domain-containing protein [Deltaproteobacteria bacterium]